MQQWILCRPRISGRPASKSSTAYRYSSISSPSHRAARHAPLFIPRHGIATLPQSAPKRPSSRLTPKNRETTQARSLLRTLLRECTYLPDSFARRWVRQHVLQRFRAYSVQTSEPRHDSAFDDPLRSKQREARQSIGLLRRANAGERRPLLRLLLMAYGRTGKRRHGLMLPLLSKPSQAELRGSMGIAGEQKGVSDSANDAVARTHAHKNPTAKDVNRGQWAPYAPELTPQLRTLLQAQIRKPPPHLTRPTLRRLQPRIEELNAWRRPMPLSRVKNQTRKWYADLLGKVHPPLPKDEWDRLRDLAAGATTEPMVRRRKAPSTSKTNALELVVKFGKPDIQAAFGNRDAHQITPRYMRRMWAQVFSQCPLMDWDAERHEWKVTWGQQALHGLEQERKPSNHRTESGGDDALLAALVLSQENTDDTEHMDDMADLDDDMDFF